MSNLISSFIIDPVVRQARRFSGAVPPSEDNAHGRRSLSHVNLSRPSPLHSPPSISAQSGQDVTGNPEARPVSLLDPVRLSSSQAGNLNDFSAAVVDDNDTDGEDRPGDDGEDKNDGTAHGPRLTPSFVPSSTPSLPVHASWDANMSSDPDQPLEDEFRQLDIRSAPVDIPNSNASTRRPTDSIPIPIPISSPLNAPSMSESLPADDGMRHLRARIHEIRSMTMDDTDKARLMHTLMTERYNLLRPQSPNSFVSNDRPFTPTSGQSIFSDIHASSPTSVASDIDPENPFNLRPGDTDPTYRVHSLDQGMDHFGEEDLDILDDEPSFGCQHYKRNVKVQCFHCRRWYTCRNCHDAVEDHNLERTKTINMLCMACGTPQKAGEHCISCGTVAAWYYCAICKLWDDDTSKKIYHCIDCGICRKGDGIGKDYLHCKRCNVCIAISFAGTHKCLERATDCDCPICGEYLFNSSSAVVSMPCGHYLHKGCYKLYMETAYKCPMCKKSAVNMELQWRKLTQAIESQPMPEQFANTRAVIQCNDCSAKSSVSYHWLGNKCNTCDSYNTNELRILNGPESEQVANALLESDIESGARSPASGTSPSSQPLRSPRYYFQPDKPEETWLPGQLPSFPFQMPQFPGMPQMQFPGMPQLQMPQMPQMPDPYEFLERVNRSFPQIRNYLNPTGEVADENVPFIDLGEERPQLKATDGSTVPQPSLPQYVLERFSRSFRNYWNPSMDDNIPRLDLSEETQGQVPSGLQFWGRNGGPIDRFAQRGTTEDDSDDASDNSSSSEESVDDAEDEEDDDGDADGDNREFDLPGHR